MISDTERREVAARLRKTIGLTEFAEALGFDWADDSDWGWKDVSDIVADLIEPTCDRDALLALADEMDADGDMLLEDSSLIVGCVGLMRCYASSIREALGAVE